MTPSFTAAIAGLGALVDSLSLIGYLRQAFSLCSRSGRTIEDHNRIVEAFFGGEASGETGRINVSGKLSPFFISVSNRAYTPFVMGAAAERLKAQFPASGNRVLNQVEVSAKGIRLHPPARRLPTITMTDGTTADLLWLYPSSCNGLVVPETNSQAHYDGTTTGLNEVFLLDERHCPIPVLVKPETSVGSWLHRQVTLQADVAQIPQTQASALFERLTPFDRHILSLCYRPSQVETGMLVLDTRGIERPLRNSEAEASSFPIVATMQGMVFGVTPDNRDPVFIEVADAVPDRVGMGPLRSITFTDGHAPLLSSGTIRWVLSQDVTKVGLFDILDLGDKESQAASVARMSSHWVAWQKHASNRLRKNHSVDVSIRPVDAGDLSWLCSAVPDKFNLPADIERRLLSGDPLVRGGIDWLRVAMGR